MHSSWFDGNAVKIFDVVRLLMVVWFLSFIDPDYRLIIFIDRNDSSFNFFLYFFVFFMQFCVSIIQCLGISGSGTV